MRVGYGSVRVDALSLDTLLQRFGAPDYVKMDIEGAEAEVLVENTQWASSVPLISVEVHSPFTLSRCRDHLRGLGFEVTSVPRSMRRRAHDCLVGTRM